MKQNIWWIRLGQAFKSCEVGLQNLNWKVCNAPTNGEIRDFESCSPPLAARDARWKGKQRVRILRYPSGCRRSLKSKTRSWWMFLRGDCNKQRWWVTAGDGLAWFVRKRGGRWQWAPICTAALLPSCSAVLSQPSPNRRNCRQRPAFFLQHIQIHEF